MHQAGIVADHDAGGGQQVDRRAEIGSAAHVAHFGNRGGDRVCRDAIVGRAEQPDRVSRIDEAPRQRDEMLGGPAFGRAVLGAWDKGSRPDDAYSARARGSLRPHSPHRARGPEPPSVGTSSPGCAASATNRSTRRGRALLSSRRASVSSIAARFAGVADAPRDARHPWNQRRLERIRQHQRPRVAVAARSVRASARRSPKPQFAVADRIFDDIAHAAHARIDRCAPRRSENVYGRLLQRLAQDGEQRLGQNGIADPRGCDEQDGFSHGVGPGAISSRAPRTRSQRGRCSVSAWRRDPSCWYRVPQYGHIASPVAATSRKTRGWLDHSGIAGFGQCSGRSAAVTSTALLRRAHRSSSALVRRR